MVLWIVLGIISVAISLIGFLLYLTVMIYRVNSRGGGFPAIGYLLSIAMFLLAMIPGFNIAFLTAAVHLISDYKE